MDNGFLHKLFDWKNFELFVKDLYLSEGDLLVEHDVTEIGKSGASRQIDVKLTQKTSFHTYTTIIECKFWKKAVERTTVDIVAASIDDLNASKGVIFTTKGYQQGAETYAKSKNIDIFVVRDLLDEEWGNPGKNIQLYLNIVGGKMSEVYFPDASAMLIVEEQPNDMSLEITLNKENVENDKFLLYSAKNGDTGPNLTKLLFEAHRIITDSINTIIGQDNDFIDQQLLVKSNIEIDLTNFEFRQLRNKYAAVNLNKMILNFATQISRSELNIDKGENLDYALIVQNYVSEQAHYVSKNYHSGQVSVSSYKNEKSNSIDSNDLFVNGSTMNCYLGPWVGIDVNASTHIAESNPLQFKVVDAKNALGFNFVLVAQ